jgi:gas vesicle protein
MSSDLFDFGFTVVDENELEAVQKASTTAQAASDTVEELQDKLNRLYNAIQPLLANLKKNPEKDYIYWPKRLKKIEDFEELISKIVE